MKRLLGLVLVPVAGLLLAVGGCGVPVQSEPHPVPLPDRTAHPSPNQTSSPAGALTQLLYLIRDGRLVRVERSVPTEPEAGAHLQTLLAGPTPAEQEQGLSSALLGTDLGLTVRVAGGQAVVELATGLEGTGRTDDILAFAQIVCTLTSRADITSVTFTRAGEQVEVPRADSSLTRAPLTAADYASLIGRSGP
ncbi:GerMN domain-containing protein [Allorhizocola rhizosphaerae]|uniref:GerMN domain-containing protein n=1 Tax=Allorhizocola rhizosphaerae TaxID=1872709 RepID=UPI0013C2BA2C|nr:GerMN domain-containing protein [Allorhizocola rhizosphaerae]